MLDLGGHGHELLRLLLPVLGDELHVSHSKHPGKIGPAVALSADCRWGKCRFTVHLNMLRGAIQGGLTHKDPQQRPHDDHHHEDHCGDDEGNVGGVQQVGPQSFESLGLPPRLPVLPADLVQGVVHRGHLH